MSGQARPKSKKSTSASESPVVRYWGRGGAGNVVKDAPSESRRASHVGNVPPSVPARRFSTGIGGAGNMARNGGRSEEIRAYQDMDMHGFPMLQSAYHTGRAGAGNSYRPNDEEVAEARENNEQIRRQSIANKEKRGSVVEKRRSSIADVLRRFSVA